jgi:hypothetical protein
LTPASPHISHCSAPPPPPPASSKPGVAPIEDPGRTIGTGSRPGSASSQKAGGTARAPVEPIPPLKSSGAAGSAPPELAEKNPADKDAAKDTGAAAKDNGAAAKDNGAAAKETGASAGPSSSSSAATPKGKEGEQAAGAADEEEDFPTPKPPTAAPAFLDRIATLRASVHDADLAPYLSSFDADLAGSADVLVVGSLTVEDAEKQEALIDAQRLAAEHEALRSHKSLVEDLEARERAARQRLIAESHRLRAESRRAEARRRDEERMREEELRREMARAEEELKYKLVRGRFFCSLVVF